MNEQAPKIKKEISSAILMFNGNITDACKTVGMSRERFYNILNAGAIKLDEPLISFLKICGYKLELVPINERKK